MIATISKNQSPLLIRSSYRSNYTILGVEWIKKPEEGDITDLGELLLDGWTISKYYCVTNCRWYREILDQSNKPRLKLYFKFSNMSKRTNKSVASNCTKLHKGS
jgi:hypothetical protein